MIEDICRIESASGPLVATAIHHGHAIRDELTPWLALPESERLREEDPYTGDLASALPSRVVGLRSRFEVDLNRPPEKAVYRTPEDAWGLLVWKAPLPEELVEHSMSQYHLFYCSMRELLEERVRRHGRFVVYDIHSYNHRRESPDGPEADPEENPEVNIGTSNMNPRLWGQLVDRFCADLSEGAGGPKLDVRRDVKFRGGHFAQWIHGAFPESGLALAIEFKKTFMDEWTGAVHRVRLHALRQALEATVPGVLAELERM